MTVGEDGSGMFCGFFTMNSFVMRPLAAAAMALGFCSPVVWAQEGSDRAISINLLDEVVVTANRYAASTSEQIQSVTVITEDDIKKSGAEYLLDLLSSQASLNFSRNGGAGKATGIYMRGLSSRHILVLVDGVRASASTTGEFDWNGLPLHNISRIEIVRGPLASLYGSDAVAGVIQIFTKSDANKFTLSIDTNQGRSISVGVSRSEKWKYGLNISDESTNGSQVEIIDPRDFGFNRKSISLNTNGPIAEGLTLSGKAQKNWGNNYLPESSGDEKFSNQTLQAELSHQINQNWRQSLSLSHFIDKFETFSSTSPSTIQTSRNFVTWENHLLNEWGTTSFGFDFWNDHAIKDRSGVIDQSVQNHGLFVQYTHTSKNVTLQFGGRFDKHSSFGSKRTWSLGSSYDATPFVKLTASYGTAFKAPTINDLYWPYREDSYVFDDTEYTDITQGNPLLRPESSKTTEFGLEYSSIIPINIRIYETKVSGLIVWDGADLGDNTTQWSPTNKNQVKIKGLDVGAEIISFGDYSLNVNYSYLDAIDLGTNKQLDRRPKNSFKSTFRYANERHSLRYEYEYYSKRNDSSGSKINPSYSISNINYGYSFDKSNSVNFKLTNVFDKKYILSQSFYNTYATEGRKFTLMYIHTF